MENDRDDTFLQRAVKRPGALTRKAEHAGESVGEYARAHEHDPGRTGRQARLAITLRKLAKRNAHRSRKRG